MFLIVRPEPLAGPTMTTAATHVVMSEASKKTKAVPPPSGPAAKSAPGTPPSSSIRSARHWGAGASESSGAAVVPKTTPVVVVKAAGPTRRRRHDDSSPPIGGASSQKSSNKDHLSGRGVPTTQAVARGRPSAAEQEHHRGATARQDDEERHLKGAQSSSSGDAAARRIARACPWLTSVPFISSSTTTTTTTGRRTRSIEGGATPSALNDRDDHSDDDSDDDSGDSDSSNSSDQTTMFRSVASAAEAVARHYGGEFCWAASFEPRFVAALMAHGFLTMAQRVADDAYALLPKLHRERCALRFADRHVSRSVRRKAGRLGVSCDRDFDGVVRGIRRHHGDECWLYPPLVDAFRAIRFQHHDECPRRQRRLPSCISGGTPDRRQTRRRRRRRRPVGGGVVAMHTFECYAADGTLVAGELGYAVGDVYTSLSGFSDAGASSSGSVQCAATAAWLERSGFALWDLGMELPYKLHMGAKPVPRADFLDAVTRARARGRAVDICHSGSPSHRGDEDDVLDDAADPDRHPVFAARDLIDGTFTPFEFATVAEEPGAPCSAERGTE